MRTSVWTGWFVVLAGALSSALACSNSTDGQGTQCGVTVDRFKELMIVDDAVMSDPRASNANDGVWSFRHELEALVPSGADPSTFAREWLENWRDTTTINGFPTDEESRASGIEQNLICPWLNRTPSNKCDAACTTCAAENLDLAQAPFRLIAIVNRMDLGGRPGILTPAGESRLIFTITNGAADDPASRPLAATIIFEYALPASKTPAQWAAAWHALGAHPAFDEAYKADLAAFTETWVGRGASPSRPNGSALSQVRSNESAFNWIWQLRQFQLTDTGDLRLSPVANTPGAPLNNSQELASFVAANVDAIKQNKALLPSAMSGGSADQFLFRWQVPGVDEATRLAFAKNTCNGCHSGENNIPVDTAFHVSPYRSGVDKLSPFLMNGELASREDLFKTSLCTQP